MKKLISMLAVFTVILSGMGAFAEEAPKYEIIGIEEMLNDKEGWNDSENLIKFENDSMSRTGGAIDSVIEYKTKKFKNEIFEFNMKLGNMQEGLAWQTIVLRSGSLESKQVWDSTQSYTFIIRPDYIDVQRWRNGNKLLGIFPCKIEEDKEFTVRVGAIDVDGGVQLIFYINGEQIVNYFDGEGYVADEGYFALDIGKAERTATVSPSKNKDKEMTDIPTSFYVSSFKRGTSELNASYKTTGEMKTTLNWYISDDYYTDNFRTGKETGKQPEELIKKIEGYENKEKYDIKDSDIGKYILIGIEDENENLNLSEAIYIDPKEYKIGKNIYAVNEYETALTDGEEIQIDENDWQVTPYKNEDVLFVPLRFAVEKTGGTVEWNEEARSVEIKGKNATSLIKIGEKAATVNGETVTLSASPEISYERTMIAYDDIKTLTGIDTKLYNDELIVLEKDIKSELTEEEAAFITKEIKE